MVKFAALKSLYDVEKTIGTGGFAKVKLGTHLLTGEKVAIKIMEKSCLGDDYPRVRIELEALKSISHHHICKLYQVIETPTHFFMIMEYCSGGELFDHIVEKNRLSESESRMFFRQILSAVAYLHSKGYVHRDLKPENILLDKNLDIKLIDFGLCAMPEGGMTTHLQTSCGSPTYAAPELIKGRKYIGSEVDVWSLGVLLFALLCGFLPFDSDTIDNLYKKILSGKYDEPPWLAKESKEIISQMLQIEPSKRISVENLLSHTWLTMGYFEPVIYSTLLELREKDDDVVDLMATYYGVCAKTMWKRLEMWQYNYDTATYQLLLVRKKQGLPLRLNTQHRPRYRIKASSIPINLELAENDVTSSPKRQSYLMLKAVMNNNDMGIYDNLIGKENNLADTSSKTVRTVRKRMHTCGPDDVQSPVPSKRTPGKGCSTPSTSSDSPVTSTTPTPSKGLFCSLEKKLNQVRNVLTPKKRIKTPNKQQMKNGEQPVILSTKNLCNVSTTSYVNPEFVLEELRKALDGKGINCKSKGFTLRGKIEESDTKSGSCKLYFELEVCLVKPAGGNVTDQPLVGIRRKRLKGDAWCYKKICEEILRLAKNSVS